MTPFTVVIKEMWGHNGYMLMILSGLNIGTVLFILLRMFVIE